MADKGGKTVCMEKSVYKNKMLDLVNDPTTYERVTCNPLEDLQKETAAHLLRLNKND